MPNAQQLQRDDSFRRTDLSLIAILRERFLPYLRRAVTLSWRVFECRVKPLAAATKTNRGALSRPEREAHVNASGVENSCAGENMAYIGNRRLGGSVRGFALAAFCYRGME
jgi:hypothetical protein